MPARFHLPTRWLLLFATMIACAPGSAVALAAAPPQPLSPSALAASADGRLLFIAGATANNVITLDAADGRVLRTTPLPASPSGLALSPDGASLYVTCAAPVSAVCVVDTSTGKVKRRIGAGHTATSPVLSADGAMLYVCLRFEDAVAFISLPDRRETARVRVAREPISAALTPDGRFLYVANHLHDGRADAAHVAAVVSVIDTATRQVVREIPLPNGSGLLRDLRISPDGRLACVAHQVSRFQLPTTQIERGWINTNAITLIDVTRQETLNTVLLDNVSSGAGNPWAVAWSPDGATLAVSHAGTHEVSLIDAAALTAKLHAVASATELAALTREPPPRLRTADVPNDLTFLLGLRRRVRVDGIGPRALVIAGTKLYAANYFSDSLSIIDLATPGRVPARVALAPAGPMSPERRGELLWNDASICFQGWQSCSSCHSSDARVDGLNWDNLNDGIGTPKNAKSLLLAHRTPPAMWTGVRGDAKTAVRAGIKHILFTVRPPEDADALDRFLQSLRPIPSPRLVQGKLSPAARRGEVLFKSAATGCARCHAGSLFTDLKPYDVGTASRFDPPAQAFDTPTLVELWRSAPYLHDGSAASVREVLTTGNRSDRHGTTQHLSAGELDDLTEYLLSL